MCSARSARSLTTEAAKTLVRVFVLCHRDYCSSLLQESPVGADCSGMPNHSSKASCMQALYWTSITHMRRNRWQEINLWHGSTTAFDFYLTSQLSSTWWSRQDFLQAVLRQLHWLPVQQWVAYRLECLVCQLLFGGAQAYQADNIHLSRGNHRSLFTRICVIPCTHNSYGDRSFSFAGCMCETACH